jgi:hypothetical protein
VFSCLSSFEYGDSSGTGFFTLSSPICCPKLLYSFVNRSTTYAVTFRFFLFLKYLPDDLDPDQLVWGCQHYEVQLRDLVAHIADLRGDVKEFLVFVDLEEHGLDAFEPGFHYLVEEAGVPALAHLRLEEALDEVVADADALPDQALEPLEEVLLVRGHSAIGHEDVQDQVQLRVLQVLLARVQQLLDEGQAIRDVAPVRKG